MTIAEKRARYWLRIMRTVKNLYPDRSWDSEREMSEWIRDMIDDQHDSIMHANMLDDIRATEEALSHTGCSHAITWH